MLNLQALDVSLQIFKLLKCSRMCVHKGIHKCVNAVVCVCISNEKIYVTLIYSFGLRYVFIVRLKRLALKLIKSPSTNGLRIDQCCAMWVKIHVQ